ncbi:hypothetical protein KIW84_013898 [Lathyrus oleraceus]|uniref:Nodule-specific Glycine Rich Peptide n=1 Tax=Pisum sativum TaxID=3888 RepID=A0A9D5BLM9_PEA|nr:hypothetical protein KIW84_013898 [Pisum sativum]
MKINSFILTFFLITLIFTTVVAIEPSKNWNKFDTIKESNMKIGIDGWSDWGSWIGWGDKAGEMGKDEPRKDEQSKSENRKELRSRFSGGGWRTWGRYGGIKRRP